MNLEENERLVDRYSAEGRSFEAEIRKIATRLFGSRANQFSYRLSDKDTVNGSIYQKDNVIILTRGLIDFAESEDEIAYVLAHEFGHDPSILLGRLVSDSINANTPGAAELSLFRKGLLALEDFRRVLSPADQMMAFRTALSKRSSIVNAEINPNQGMGSFLRAVTSGEIKGMAARMIALVNPDSEIKIVKNHDARAVIKPEATRKLWLERGPGVAKERAYSSSYLEPSTFKGVKRSNNDEFLLPIMRPTGQLSGINLTRQI